MKPAPINFSHLELSNNNKSTFKLFSLSLLSNFHYHQKNEFSIIKLLFNNFCTIGPKIQCTENTFHFVPLGCIHSKSNGPNNAIESAMVWEVLM
jgi:hypothetical protein